MYNVNIANTRNRKLVEQKGNISIFEYALDIPYSKGGIQEAFFAAQIGMRKRQALFQVDQYNSVVGKAGILQWSTGQVQIASNYNELSEYSKKMLGDDSAAKIAAKHLYQGNGLIMLDATYDNLIIEDVGMWNGMIINDDIFYACNATVGISTIAKQKSNSANVFDTCLTGSGMAVLKSRYPREELVEIFLNGDELRVDGDYVVAWSQGLSYTVECATSAPEDADKLVNVYRGTGKILLAPL